MTGIGLLFLLLALIAICSGLYFAAWFFCSVQRSSKEGHYILESEEDPELGKGKLYSGLDMVDEAKETYVRNNLDLDSINENKPPVDDLHHSPSAPEEKHQEDVNSMNQE